MNIGLKIQAVGPVMGRGKGQGAGMSLVAHADRLQHVVLQAAAKRTPKGTRSQSPSSTSATSGARHRVSRARAGHSMSQAQALFKDL